MAVRQLSDGNDDGTTLGQSSTDLVSFHGVTTVDMYAIVSNVSGTLGDTNAAVSLLIALLKEKGLMARA
jgi:hypothetical protein